MMKQIFYGLLIAILLTSCSKQVNTITTTTDTTGTGTSTSTVPPKLKFFNVMDYGPVSVTLNNNVVSSSLYLWYPTAYQSGIIGTNNVQIQFGGSTVVYMPMDLLAGKSYSCFIYRVGYNWKISLVPDNFTTPTSGNTAIRMLDFRTQAYFNYVDFSLYLGGTFIIGFPARNFLDHQSYGSYTTFNSMSAGTYTYNIFNNSTGATLKSGTQVLSSGKVYTVVLMTQADLSPTDALNNIQVDCEANY